MVDIFSAFEPYDISGDDEPSTELQRLDFRKRRKLLPRNTGREAKVIFDAGTRTGLTAGCISLHQ
jgi:hypothetical protein